VLALPNQTRDLIEQYRLSRADVDRDAWALDATGGKWSGAAAINRVWRELGGVWRVVAEIYRFPPIRWLENRAYRWIADHRTWLSGWWGVEPEWKADDRES
jgi:predicted DCC family thiol-disulfide oxidoreductase YuxK